MIVAPLLEERPTPETVVLRLNRPERLNALNDELVDALRGALATIAEDDAVRVVVLTGAGRGFCAGLDLKGFGPAAPPAGAPPAAFLRFQEMMAALPASLRALRQPVIAAVNGPAAGGGFALCLGADIRICSTAASFSNGAVRIGLSGGEMGMSYHLPRIVGTSIAADWMLTGRKVSAEEAFRGGLVSALLDPDDLLDHALDLAAQIAANSPLGMEFTKRVLHVNADAPSLASALELENRSQLITVATPESADAMGGWKSS